MKIEKKIPLKNKLGCVKTVDKFLLFPRTYGRTTWWLQRARLTYEVISRPGATIIDENEYLWHLTNIEEIPELQGHP